MIWIYLGLAVALGAAIALAVVAAVGRESLERPGVLRLDTPAARSALRRCNPERAVHYFAGLDLDRCECGRVGYWAKDGVRVVRTVEGVPPEVRLRSDAAQRRSVLDPPATTRLDSDTSRRRFDR